MARIMTVRPPDKLHFVLKEIAGKRGLTVNCMVIQILWDWVKQHSTYEEEITNI